MLVASLSQADPYRTCGDMALQGGRSAETELLAGSGLHQAHVESIPFDRTGSGVICTEADELPLESELRAGARANLAMPFGKDRVGLGQNGEPSAILFEAALDGRHHHVAATLFPLRFQQVDLLFRPNRLPL
jgi:hypothetical protein